MNESSTKIIFCKIQLADPSTDICKIVMGKIDHVRIIRGRIRITSYFVLSTGIIITLIPAVQYFISDLTQSGFLNYSSLIISDSSYVMSNWKEFALSMLESVPIIASSITIGLVLVFTISVRNSLRGISALNIRSRHQHITA